MTSNFHYLRTRLIQAIGICNLPSVILMDIQNYWGTPGLKPMTNYNLNGNYIWKQKYIFGLFFTHTSDYFTQAAYPID